MEKAIEMIGIRKEFPGIVANDNINISVEEGEIHALVGENGAGKSTLMNVLFGLYKPEAGSIKIRGQEIELGVNSAAIDAGVGMVHQSFKLVPSFTVAENITLGSEPRKGIFVDKKAVREQVIEISDKFGLKVDPDALIQDLPVGIQQRVEILKTLYRNADILILDEPTGVLTPQETDELFEVIRSLVAGGKTVIFITHKLREVMMISDTVTVMRRGRIIGSVKTKDTSPNELATMMVGREVVFRVHKTEAQPKETILSVKNLKVLDDRYQEAVQDVSFDVRSGEILGIAGVEGNGQSELVDAIVGLRTAIRGEINLANTGNIVDKCVNDRRNAGISCVPEDRYTRGLSMQATLEENMIVDKYNHSPFSKGHRLDLKYIKEHTEELIKEYDVRTTGPSVQAYTLSGGNLQKIVLARELSSNPSFLIVSQPTRGLDVGSIEFVHKRIIEARDNGAAVLLVSAELDEIMSLSDRIAVLYEGQVMDTVVAKDATESQLGLLMAGVHHEEPKTVSESPLETESNHGNS